MLRDECPICKDGALGMKFIRDYFLFQDDPIRKISVEDIARHYALDPQDVYDHINNHDIVITSDCINLVEKKSDKTGRVLRSPDILLDELSTLYNIVRNVVDHIQENGEWDSTSIDQLTKLSKECTNIISKIGEFQGRIGAKTNETKILQIDGDLNMITVS